MSQASAGTASLRSERGLITADDEENQPLLCPGDTLEHEMHDAAGGQADMLLHVGESQLDYSHLPPPGTSCHGQHDQGKNPIRCPHIMKE